MSDKLNLFIGKTVTADVRGFDTGLLYIIRDIDEDDITLWWFENSREHEDTFVGDEIAALNIKPMPYLDFEGKLQTWFDLDAHLAARRVIENY